MVVHSPRKRAAAERVSSKINILRSSSELLSSSQKTNPSLKSTIEPHHGPLQDGPPKALPRNVVPKTRPEKIPEDGLIVINGRKKSGKTYMCHWLLSRMGPKYDAGMFISDSMHTIMQWRKNIPKSFIFQEMNIEMVENWIDVVKTRNDKRVERGLPMRKYLLVLDDIGYDSKTINSKPMLRLIQNARQVGVSVWIITQYLYQLHQQLREAIDFAICFRETSAKALKKIKDDVFHILGSDFDAVFKAATGRSRKRRIDQGETEKEYDKACPPRAICIDNRIGGAADSWHDCISCVYADYRDVEKPWRLANPVHYILDEMTFVNDAERRSKEDVLKGTYARSEVGLQVYNNDFIDKIKTKAVFLLEEDYVSQMNEVEDGQRSIIGAYES